MTHGVKFKEGGRRKTPLFLPKIERKGVSRMSDDNTIFILTKDDVIACARQMGIPEQAITDDVLHQVKKGVEWGLECWSEVMKDAINMALKG